MLLAQLDVWRKSPEQLLQLLIVVFSYSLVVFISSFFSPAFIAEPLVIDSLTCELFQLSQNRTSLLAFGTLV